MSEKINNDFEVDTQVTKSIKSTRNLISEESIDDTYSKDSFSNSDKFDDKIIENQLNLEYKGHNKRQEMIKIFINSSKKYFLKHIMFFLCILIFASTTYFFSTSIESVRREIRKVDKSGIEERLGSLELSLSSIEHSILRDSSYNERLRALELKFSSIEQWSNLSNLNNNENIIEDSKKIEERLKRIEDRLEDSESGLSGTKDLIQRNSNDIDDILVVLESQDRRIDTLEIYALRRF